MIIYPEDYFRDSQAKYCKKCWTKLQQHDGVWRCYNIECPNYNMILKENLT